LGYDGQLRDRVGQNELALSPDGQLDGVFTVTLNVGSGNRTVTRLQLNRAGPIGVWNTQAGDGFWSLGAASGLDTALLNNTANDSVNFAVAEGSSFKIFAADYLGQMFVVGSGFTLSANFADGSTAAASVTINPQALTIVSSSLPSGTVNVAYSPQTFTASGGTSPYTWSVASGSLPTGLSLSQSGTISGTPTAAGTSTFTVQVRDNALVTATQSFNLTINSPISTSGLVGYWSFDDGTASDNSGNGNNGTLINNPAVVAGKSGQALSFDGGSQYVNVGNVLDPKSSDLSIFAWVKTTQAGGLNMLISKRNSSVATNPGYQLFQNGSGTLSFTFGNGASSRVRVDSTAPRINDGNWHLVGVVYTRAANGVIYVDGVPATGGSGSITSQSGFVANSLPLRFGLEDQTNQAFHWNGAIDQVRIYNRALSAQEVSDIYNAGG